ncbi:MAG TPA: DsbA family protein [Candidatus Dormibacteraeota bacterium]|nr:DsbA family protein [Candidatus Dormibacteraeota bacterium]
MEEITFHFDPVCPWAWLTSRWATRLVDLGDVAITWRFFSLGIVHLEPGQDTADGPVGYSGAALQLLALARRQGGNELVATLYTELGRLIHAGGSSPTPELGVVVLETAMRAAGMDPADRRAAMSDRSLWQEVVADHAAAVASCEAFGVPTLILDAGKGPGLFGPVITEVPSDDEARALLRDVVRMARRPYLFELKRERYGHPPQLLGTA